jgi:beta-N-acetylhexosaminidase
VSLWKDVGVSPSHRPAPAAGRRVAGIGLLGVAVLGAGLYGAVAVSKGGGTSTATTAASTRVAATPDPSVRPAPRPVRHRPAAASAAPLACGTAATMSLRAAVAQTLMVGVASPSRAQLRRLTRDGAAVGGLFLRGDGSRVLTDGRLAVAARAAVPPLVAADDEGGRVQRIAFAYSMPSARDQAASMSPAQVRALAEHRGRALRRFGITMDLAPVIDIGGRPDGTVIGDRAYASRPDRVTRYARAFAAGLRAAGVLPALKHFPGHGRAHGDSHLGRATTPGDTSLRRLDWAPYRDLAEPGVAVMMGHLQVPGLSTRGLPASVDPRLYRVLRREIGFGGLVLTDELAGMQAIRARFGLHESIRRAIGAGADLALFNASPERVEPLLRHLVADVRAGRLPENRVRDAAGRVLAAKGCR